MPHNRVRAALLRWLRAVEPTIPEPPKPRMSIPLSDGELTAERPESWASPSLVLLTLRRGEATMKVRVPVEALRQIADRYDTRAGWQKGMTSEELDAAMMPGAVRTYRPHEYLRPPQFWG